MSIDFSKAPEGATHYGLNGESPHCWYKITEGRRKYYYMYDGDNDWNYNYGVPAHNPIKIPTNKYGQYTPKTDRERMLCDAVIMKCRGIDVEILRDGVWGDSVTASVKVTEEYRRAPKLPEIPWEWIDDKYSVCVVDRAGNVGFKTSEESNSTQIGQAIKLDLTDVELPVTVKRPGGG